MANVKNNAEYFQHSAGLRDSKKVKVLRSRFGQRLGYAYFSLMLEWLAGHDGLEWEYTDLEIEMFGAELEITGDQVREITEYCIKIELLSLTPEGFITSNGLNRRLESMFERRGKERKRMKEKRANVAPTSTNKSDVAATSKHVAPTSTHVAPTSKNERLLLNAKQELEKDVAPTSTHVAPTSDLLQHVAATNQHNRVEYNIYNNSNSISQNTNVVNSDFLQKSVHSKKSKLLSVFDDENLSENQEEKIPDPFPEKEKNEEPPKVAQKGSAKIHKVEVRDSDGVSICRTLESQIKLFRQDKPDLYPEVMLDEFLVHWSEPNDRGVPAWITAKESGKSKRFNLAQRLAKWKTNNFNKNAIVNSNGKISKGADQGGRPNGTRFSSLQPTGKGSFERIRGTVFSGLEE